MTQETAPVRAFISLDVAPDVIEALQQFQQALDKSLPRESVRWGGPEQMHLTLKFLGNVDANRIEDLKAVLEPLSRGFGPMQLRAEGLGCFPSRRNPRVIWAGLQGDLHPLEQLQEQVEQLAAPWVEKPESRRFHPHLTLGRVRETAARRAREIGQVLEATTVPSTFGRWCSRQFCLMRSQLSPKGAIYTVLASVPLLKEANATA